MGFGLTNPRIDNWGHGGGLLGGAALAYLTGPNLMLESDDPRGLSMRRKLVNRPKVQSALRAVKDFWDEDDEDDEDDARERGAGGERDRRKRGAERTRRARERWRGVCG